jgi:hypothetical protein
MGRKSRGIIFLVIIVAVSILGYFIFRVAFTTKGQIFVDAYPAGCNVYLNGELKGTTPLTLNNLSFGQYVVKISKEGYATVTRNVSLDSANTDQIVMVALEHATFILQVNSTPVGADVYVDGVNKGVTPLEINDLVMGPHFVEVKMDNYARWTAQIDEGQEVGSSTDNPIVLEATLLPSSASITINSVPTGAKVIVNDVEQGTTPFEMDNVEPGTYQILVIKDGYVPYSEDITIAKGDKVERDLALKQASTFLMIDTIPEGADVYLNGSPKGQTPYAEANLAPGTYKLRLVKDGYLEFSTEVDVVQGQTSDYSYSLLKLP